MQLSRKQQKIAANRAANKQDDDSKYMNIAVVAIAVFFGAGMVQFMAMSCGICGGAKQGPVGAGSWSTGGPVGFLDVTKEEQVKQAFFEGNPFIVYCQNDKSEGTPAPKVVQDISGELQKNNGTADVQVVTANCFKPMVNGKTIAQTWNFGKNEGFIAVFTAGKKPVQLNYMPDGKYVAKQVKPMVKTAVTRVVYLRDFEGCQGNKNCVILASKKKDVLGRMEARMKPLLKSHRNVNVVSVDSSFYKVTVDAEFAKQKPEQGEDAQYGEAICIAKNTHNDDFEEFKDPKGFKKANMKKEKVLKAAFMKSWETEAELNDFLAQCENGGEESWFQLSKEVAVKARSGEAKVVKATRPKGAKGNDATDGTKKGKEHVGRRPDEKVEEEEEEEEEEGEEEEEVEEEVEL